MTHWLYPTNASGTFHLLDPITGEPTAVSPRAVWRSVEAAPGRMESWYLSQGFRSMAPGNLLWLRATGAGELYAVGEVHGVRFDDSDGCWYADFVFLADLTAELMDAPLPRSRLNQVVRAPVPANAEVAILLDAWLAGRPSASSSRADGESSPLERVPADILRRRGQRAFRSALFAAYGGRCAVTGETAEEVLEAAHIDPFSKTGCNDVNNGLLLRADVHTLFDLHLIAVDPEGCVLVSSRLRDTSYAVWSGKALARPRIPDAAPDPARLAVHRARCEA